MMTCPEETLEIEGTFTILGVLHGIMCSELLQREVREAVKDLEYHQGLHRIQIKLKEADVQV